MKIIMLNGPPGSGKDTLAQDLELCIQRNYEVGLFSFKDCMHDLLNYDYLKGILADTYREQDVTYDNLKQFNPTKLREISIHFFEFFIKPVFGKSFPAEYVCKSINAYSPKVAIITDLGFQEEYNEVVRWFGEENCTVVKIFRNGKYFDEDTRTYIEGKNIVNFYNYDKSTENYKIHFNELYKKLINE